MDILTFVDIARSTKKRNDASDSDQSDIEDLHTFLNNLLDSELPSLMVSSTVILFPIIAHSFFTS